KTENPNVQRLVGESNPLSKINALFNMSTGAAASGLAGRSKTLHSEVILKDWEHSGKGFEPGRMAAGLGIDIALDPLTYIPFVGLAGAVGKAGKGVLKARPGIQAGQEAGSATAAVAKEAPLQITAGGSGRHF